MKIFNMKDPAFLFYSKDWIEGTAELTIQSKGIYIDLLCYQHQKGDIPRDIEKIARLVRLSKDELLPFWDEIKDKFEPNGERMVNRKLNQVMTERSEKGKRNKIIGTYASLMRRADLNKKNYKIIKDQFKADEFMHIDSECLTERLSEWLEKRLKSIANANADEDIIKESKKFIPPTLEHVKNYFKENGYTEQVAIRAFNYYQVANWHDSKGNKIKNWKQKMQGVWFKDENKLVIQKGMELDDFDKRQLEEMKKNGW